MKPAVLVVDDEPNSIEQVQRILEPGFEVTGVDSAERALVLLSQQPFAVLLCAQRMPGMTGMELLRRAWRLQPFTKRMLVTSQGELDSLVDALDVAHVDHYVAKPFEPMALRERVVELHAQFALEQQSSRSDKLLARSMAERERELLTVVHELERKNELLREAALRDWLTGTYNHRSFRERLNQEVGRARRDHSDVSLLFFAVDHFGRFNELNTHAAGDALLQRVAGFLSGTQPGSPPIRASDVLARYNADVFALILPATGKDGATFRANQLVDAFRLLDFEASGVLPDGRLRLSCGVAAFPEDCRGANELVGCAEDALRRAKDEGRDRVVSFAQVASGRPTLYRNRQSLLGKLAPIHRSGGILFNLTLQLSCLSRLEHGADRSPPPAQVEAFERLALDAVASSHLFAAEELGGLVSEHPGVLHVFIAPLEARTRMRINFLEDRAARLAEFVERGLRELPGGTQGVLRVVSSCAAELYRGTISFQQQLDRLCTNGLSLLPSAMEARRGRERLELQRIILAREIQSFCQPIYGGSPRECVGHELLSRGPPQGWFRSPSTLLDVADDVHLTSELDLCLIQQCLRSARALPGEGLIFINVLPTTLCDPVFVGQELKQLLTELDLPPSRLVLEISERQTMEDPKPLLKGLQQVRSLGVALALDDLGTRNANLNEIATFRPNWLKLDRSLVMGVHEDSVKQSLIRAVVDVGRSQGAHVLAEGIEEAAELETLQTLHVTYFQGYLLGRPRPLEAPSVPSQTDADPVTQVS